MLKCLAILLFLVPALVQAQVAPPPGPAKRGGFMDSLKQAASSARDKALGLLQSLSGGEVDASAAYRRLTDMRLANIFKDPTFADSETWPKVAIRQQFSE